MRKNDKEKSGILQSGKLKAAVAKKMKIKPDDINPHVIICDPRQRQTQYRRRTQNHSVGAAKDKIIALHEENKRLAESMNAVVTPTEARRDNPQHATSVRPVIGVPGGGI